MAARFLIAGGNGNWTSTTNWSATSGGASGASAPTSADDVTFDVNSGSQNITLNTSTRACKTLVITSGYTGTMVMSNGLNVSGIVSLGANMGISGSGALAVIATANLTSNGKVWPNALTLNFNVTYTLLDNWTVSGLVTLGATSATTTINGFAIYCGAGLTFQTTTGTVTGTTAIILNGTGTYNGGTNGTISLSIEINTAGTITLGTNIRQGGGTLKYTAGTVVSTGSTLTLSAGSTITCNASGMTFGTISVIGGNQVFNGTHGFTNAQRCLINSSSASSEFYLNYSGSTMAVSYCNLIDVNSSGGSPMFVYSASTLTRTTNWTNLTQIGSGSGSGGIMRNPSLS